MTSRSAHLAIDLGAESGRAMLGLLHEGKVALHEVHRFPNQPLRLPDGLHWDVGSLWKNIGRGLESAAQWCRTQEVKLCSVGVDTWGVDFALLGRSGEVLTLPRCYRDERFARAQRKVHERLGGEVLYSVTGLQNLPFNTLFQLASMHEHEPGLLGAAHSLVFMPDLFHYLLSGRAVQERTIASTSQMLDARTGVWRTDLLEQLAIPHHYLGSLTDAPAMLEEIRPALRMELGLSEGAMVVAPAGHDTASAVAAVPTGSSEDWCYLSSGTWSLLGAELKEPCLTQAACAAGFTNERGLGGRVRFLKNIAGLWVLQECRRTWEAKGAASSYEELVRLATDVPACRTLIDLGRPEFLVPGAMPDRIVAFARATNQPAPDGPAAFARCIFDSLALAYRQVFTDLQEVLGRRFGTIHLVGGGARNRLLNQMTADATGCTVLAGPVEATAIGNVLAQAMGSGLVADLASLREVVRRCTVGEPYVPDSTARWQEAADRLRGFTVPANLT